MNLSRSDHARLEDEIARLTSSATPFATATVVRTVDATSAKPGAKALIDAQGTILMGWVGGGCARGAVSRAAQEALATGAPQLISLRPQDILAAEGLTPGEVRDGVKFARNGCPSKGTMDIFVEPVLPLPRLAICGTGLVALALADLAARFDYRVTLAAQDPASGTPHATVAGFDLTGADFIVVATQGAGDLDALRAAVAQDARYVGFVGSTRKFATLRDRLTAQDPGLSNRLGRVEAPAGLRINAITPEEIALSIIARITDLRRARDPGA